MCFREKPVTREQGRAKQHSAVCVHACAYQVKLSRWKVKESEIKCILSCLHFLISPEAWKCYHGAETWDLSAKCHHGIHASRRDPPNSCQYPSRPTSGSRCAVHRAGTALLSSAPGPGRGRAGDLERSSSSARGYYGPSPCHAHQDGSLQDNPGAIVELLKYPDLKQAIMQWIGCTPELLHTGTQ